MEQQDQSQKAFDLTSPLYQVADAYRAMDERRVAHERRPKGAPSVIAAPMVTALSQPAYCGNSAASAAKSEPDS